MLLQEINRASSGIRNRFRESDIRGIEKAILQVDKRGRVEKHDRVQR